METISRKAWMFLEPYHAMIYFAPEAREAFKFLGLKGFWMGYFASRAAPMGAVSAPVVTATFYNFQPEMVERAIPTAWSIASPEQIWHARMLAADAALQRLLGEKAFSPEVQEAAELARLAVEGCSVAGRVLFSAHTALPWPEQPHLQLWQATTLLREFRGDGHISALLAAGLDGCEAHLIQIGSGRADRKMLQESRGWTDAEWQGAQERLQERDLLDEGGKLTERGENLHLAVEQRTDLLALPPWRSLGEQGCQRLLDLVYGLSSRIIEQQGVPIPNPIGLPWPAHS